MKYVPYMLSEELTISSFSYYPIHLLLAIRYLTRKHHTEQCLRVRTLFLSLPFSMQSPFSNYAY